MHCILPSFLSLVSLFNHLLRWFSAITRETTKIWQKKAHVSVQLVSIHHSCAYLRLKWLAITRSRWERKNPEHSALLLHSLAWYGSYVCFMYQFYKQSSPHAITLGILCFHPPLPTQSTEATAQYFSPVAFHFSHVSSTSGCLFAHCFTKTISSIKNYFYEWIQLASSR